MSCAAIIPYLSPHSSSDQQYLEDHFGHAQPSRHSLDSISNAEREGEGVPRRNEATALHSIIILCFNAYEVARKNIRGVRNASTPRVALRPIAHNQNPSLVNLTRGREVYSASTTIVCRPCDFTIAKFAQCPRYHAQKKGGVHIP